jgi:hypothetical protein
VRLAPAIALVALLMFSAHRDRTDAGHDLAFRQMTVTHEPLAAIIGQLVGVTLSKAATSASTACAKSARP